MRFIVGFNGRTISNAQDRQSKMDGWGFWCARCGESLHQKKWVAIPRVPNRKDSANCVILCSDCFSYVESNITEDIPYTMLPFYHTSPPNWHREDMFEDNTRQDILDNSSFEDND